MAKKTISAVGVKEYDNQKLLKSLERSLSNASAANSQRSKGVAPSNLDLGAISKRTAAALSEELSRYVKVDEDPESAREFLRAFSAWIERKRKTRPRLKGGASKGQ